jgi:hypothetical protein
VNPAGYLAPTVSWVHHQSDDAEVKIQAGDQAKGAIMGALWVVSFSGTDWRSLLLKS